MSVLKLPVPDNWDRAGRLPWWAILGIVATISFMVVQGVLAVVRGSYLTAGVVFGWITFPVLLCTALLLAAVGKVRTQTTHDATGFTVWPDKRLAVLLYIGLVVAVPTGMLFAILLPRGQIDLSMSRGQQIFWPSFGVAAAFFAMSGLIALWRRGGVGYLKFTPAMVEIADVVKTDVVEWGDIVDIKDHSDTKQGKRAGRSVVLCLRDGSEKVVGGLHQYVPTGVPLYWMVRHYWRHPEDRMELVDSRASERLRSNKFDLA